MSDEKLKTKAEVEAMRKDETCERVGALLAGHSAGIIPTELYLTKCGGKSHGI